MVQELSERAARVHAQLVDPSTDNMLKITSDGRKLGLDQRVINPDLPDDPNSKVNRCVDNIHRIWQDGQADRLTPLVFCDLSTPKTGATGAKAAKTAVPTALTAAIRIPVKRMGVARGISTRSRRCIRDMPMPFPASTR